MQPEVSIPFDRLEAFIHRAMMALGLPDADAMTVATLMAEADLQGSDGHGVTRLPSYARRIRAGGVNVRPNIRIAREQAGTALGTALGQSFPGARVVTAASLAEAEAALEREPEFDALLLDLDMPGMDGLTGLALLRSNYPAVPVIVVSAAQDGQIVRRCAWCWC